MRFRLMKSSVTCVLVPLATLLTVAPGTSKAQGKPIAAMSPELQADFNKTIDAARFLQTTGWEPRVGLIDGVRAILERDYGLATPALYYSPGPPGGQHRAAHASKLACTRWQHAREM